MSQSITIERMSYGADAIGHLANGKTVFVEGGAPGDIVRVAVVEDQKSFARATIEEIDSPSPSRVAPISSIDQVCGTAPWQHLEYSCQLECKRNNVVGALVHTARLPQERAEGLVTSCLKSHLIWNYRNKLELTCGIGPDGRFAVGFCREGTNQLMPADSSKLVHSAIEKAPKALRGAIRYAQGDSDFGIFRIGVRHSKATDEMEVAIWTPPSAFPRAVFAKTLSTALNTTSIVRVIAEPGKARKIKGVETLDGRGYWRERLGDIEFSTQAPSFFQVNTAQAEELVSVVLGLLGNIEGAFVADLYAGGGTFSIPLALAGADVMAIESAKSSVRDLRYNADANGVDLDIVGGDAAREFSNTEGLDALVVDPPRAGLAPEVIHNIAAASPERIAYVSCNPSTWARDVTRLDAVGYTLEAAHPVDLFPQTYHVEVASIFTHKR